MKYETFNPKIHNIKQVAGLIYDVDYRTFDMLFKSKNSAITAISKSLKEEDLETFTLILEDKKIIGILIYYINNFPRHFYLKSLRLLIVDILDYFVLSDVNEGDLYIAELAIDKSHRGKGLGKKVISDVIEYASHKNLNCIKLDADFRNTGAKKLYEKIGFEVYNKKRVKFLKFERGMYHMQYCLKD